MRRLRALYADPYPTPAMLTDIETRERELVELHRRIARLAHDRRSRLRIGSARRSTGR